MSSSSSRLKPATVLISVALMTFVLLQSACSGSKDVNLSPKPPSNAPTPAPSKATDGTQGTESPVGQNPVPTPQPKPPHFRIVCEYPALGELQTISSLARSQDVASVLKIDDISGSTGPLALPVALQDVVEVLYEGAHEPHVGSPGPRQIFLSTADLLTRTGHAKELRLSVGLDPAVLRLAERVGLHPRNYAVSDLGHYLLLPAAKGIEVVSRASLKVLGLIPLRTSAVAQLSFFENDGVLTALVFGDSKFHVVVRHVAISPQSVEVDEIPVEDPSSGQSAFEPQWWGHDRLVWAEAALGAGEFQPTGLQLITLDLASGRQTRSVYNPQSQGARVSPHIAVIGAPLAPQIVTAVEKLSASQQHGTGDRPFQIDEGREVVLKLNNSPGSPVVSEVESLPYADFIVQQSKDYGVAGPFALRKILAPKGASEAILSLNSLYGDILFKVRSGQLQSIGEDDCRNPNAIEETL